MSVWLWAPVVVMSLAALAGAVVLIIRDEQPPPDWYFGVLGVLVLTLLVQTVGGCLALSRTDREIESVVYVAYLFTALLLVPVGAALALVERTRWGTGVLAVMAFAVLACELRLHALWTAHA